MRKLDFVPTFKKEMSNIEIEGVEAIVKNYKFETAELMGSEVEFAYTSSSGYATHNIMSTLTYNDEGTLLEINHIGITENNMLILVCSDENENEDFFEIEPKDF